MKVFVLTSGEYDDYGIEAIFSTREKALEFIPYVKEKVNEDDITEYELDPSIEGLEKYEEYFHFSMGEPGTGWSEIVRLNPSEVKKSDSYISERFNIYNYSGYGKTLEESKINAEQERLKHKK